MRRTGREKRTNKAGCRQTDAPGNAYGLQDETALPTHVRTIKSFDPEINLKENGKVALRPARMRIAFVDVLGIQGRGLEWGR
jgi:hypothetical protein